MKTTLTLSAAILSGMIAFVSCSHNKNPEAEKALANLTHYVDSIVSINGSWKTLPDTLFQEVPIDPKDPTLIRIDTIVISPETKTTILYPPGEHGFIYHSTYIEEYNRLLTAVEPFTKDMSESMKKELTHSKNKFETLLPPPLPH